MRCLAYMRCSGLAQVDGDSFPRQKEKIEKYAASNGLTIVGWYQESITGKSDLENRPELVRLMTALDDNVARIVIIEKLDRMARSILVQESILGDFKKKGFEVISCCEPDLLSDDPSRVMMRQILGVFAEYERAMIVMRTRAAKERIRKEFGKCEGPKYFGAKDGEQQAFNYIVEKSRLGQSYVKIAASLNELNYPTRRGRSWYPSTVRQIALRAKVAGQ